MFLRLLLPIMLASGSPYEELETLFPYNGHCFMTEPNKKMLHHLILTRKVRTVVEVGSWLGKSAIFMAKHLPKGGHLYAVDTWLGSFEHSNEKGTSELLPTLYEQFLSNVIHEGLEQTITPMRMTSLEGAEALQGKLKPDLIYLDAAHDEKSVYEDLCAWYPYVEEEGLLCGDDWTWGSVRAALKRFAKERNLRIRVHSNFWWLVGPRK